MLQGEGMYPAPTHKRIDELDAKLAALQKSTRASFPIMVAFHDILRQRFRWYYNWHMNSWSNFVHWTALTGYTVIAFTLLLTLVFKGPAQSVMAASQQAWASPAEWKSWKLDNLDITPDGLTLSARNVASSTSTKLAQAEPTITLPTTDTPTTIVPSDTATPEVSPEVSPSPTTDIGTEATPTASVSEPVASPTVLPSAEVQTVYVSKGTATTEFSPQKLEIVDWLSAEAKEKLNDQSIIIEYSTDGILWLDSVKSLADSDKIYLRLTFETKDQLVTPVLSSLAVNYSRLPKTPDNLKVGEKSGLGGFSAVLSAGAFSDPDSDLHKASEWQVTDKSGEYDKPLVDTNTDTKNLTSYTVGKKLADNAYYFRVRYQDTTGAWSPWSKEYGFSISEKSIAVLGEEQAPQNPNEEIANRTETTKTIDNKNGTKTLESYTGIIHYKDNYNKDTKWKDINPNHYIDFPDFVLYDQLPSTVKVFKNKIGYEIESRRTGEKYTVELDSLDGTPKISQSSGANGLVSWADINSKNAVSQNTNSKIGGLIKKVFAQDIQTFTKGDSNLKFEFAISENGVRLWKTIEGPDAPKNFTWKITKSGNGNDLKFRDKPDAFDVTNTDTGAIDTSKPVVIDAKKISGDMNSTFIWQETAPKSDMKIDTDVYYSYPSCDQSTHPCDILNPVVDGFVYQNYQSTTWSTLRDAVNTASDSTNNSWYMVGWNTTVIGNHYLYRSIFVFDTSAIPSTGTTISAANLTLYGNGEIDTGTARAPDISIYTANPASATSLTPTDFRLSVYGLSPLTNTITYNDWGVSNTFNFTSPNTQITKSGFSKFSARNASYDAGPTGNGVDPGSGVAGDHYLTGYFADQAGTLQDPVLSVTYTVAPPVTISGTVYTAENKSTNIGAGKTVSLSINGAAKVDATTDADGAFTFSQTIDAGNTIALYLSGDTSKASYITIANDGTTSITGLELYTGHIILSHESAGPISNVLLATANTIADTDILISTASGNTTFTAGNTVRILSGKTYTPGGTVTLENIQLYGTFVPAANAVTVSGNWNATGGTFTNTSSTITFTATSGKTITSGGQAFNNMTFNGIGGVWSLQDALVTAASSTLTITNGTLDLANQNFTIGTSGTFTNSGTLRLVGGTQTITNLTIPTTAGTTEYTGTGSYTGLKAGNSYNNLKINGSGGTYTLNADLTVNGDMAIPAGTLAASTYTINIAGSWDATGGTFNKGSGTVIFNGSAVGETITSAGQQFNNMTVSGAFPKVSDTFDTSINPVYWGEFNSNNPTTVSGGRAHVYVATNGGADGGGLTGYGKWYLHGDFDIQVDYQMIAPQAILQLSDNADINSVDPSTVYGIYYATGFGSRGGMSGSDSTALTTSKFRMVRSGTSMTGYFWNGGWIQFSSASNVNQGDLYVNVIGGNVWNHAEVYYDNFIINSGTTIGTAGITSLTLGLQDSLSVANTLSITAGTLTAGANTVTTHDFTQSGGTFNAPSTNMYVSGNFANSGGTFNNSSGTVNLTGTDSSTQQISGSTTFNNLTASTSSNSAGRTLQFAAGSTTTVAGTWTVTGYSGKVITLAPSSAATWYIYPSAWTVDYVSVSYSTNQAGAKINPTNSAGGDGGNNLNWFPVVPAAPSGANINTEITTGFTVGWNDNSSDETGFKVYTAFGQADCSAIDPGDYTLESTTAADAESQAISSKSVNTQYCAKVTATNADGDSTASYAAPHYTLANVPAAPTLGTVTSSIIPVTINVNSNPSSTTFAIKVVDGGTNYVQANGTSGASPVWQTASVWASPKNNTGLTANTLYTYSVAATNGDSTVTAYSTTAAATTLATYTVTTSADANSTITATASYDAGTSPAITFSATAGYISTLVVDGVAQSTLTSPYTFTGIAASHTIAVTTATTNTCVWTGLGADNNWSTTLNWSGDAVPTASCDVIFDATNTKASTINGGFTNHIKSFSLNSGYTDTLTMAVDLNIDGDAILAAGTIDGSASHYTFYVAGSWTNTGTTFATNKPSVDFNGDIPFKTITTGGQSFYNMTVAGGTSYGSNQNTLRPNSDIETVGFQPQFCTNRYDCVSDQSDTTYITAIAHSGVVIATFGTLANSVPSDATNIQVTDYIRVKTNDVANNAAYPELRVSGVDYDNSGPNVSTVFTDFYTTWTTNPNSPGGTAPWTVPDLASTFPGVKVDVNGAVGLQVSEVWMVISYSTPLYGGWTLQDNLTVENATTISSDTLTSGANTVTTKDYSQSGGTFNAPSTNMNVSGNFARTTGTFTPGAGTVNLTGAGGLTQAISGQTTFNNLVATATASRAINFASGTTQTVTGTWTVTGAAGQLLTLGRDGGTGSDQWHINPTAWSIDYVNVTNSENMAGARINPTNSIDGGNNTNWFPAAPTAPSGVSINTQTTTGFTVGWTDNSSDETGFKVYTTDTGTANCATATYSGTPDYTTAADAVTQAITGKSINTQYCAAVKATNAVSDSAAAYSSAAYTLANVPDAPTVDTPTTTSLKVTINAASNPAATQFAIFNETANMYIKADGSMADLTPVWQTVAQWNTTGYTVNTGLAPGTSYTYQVKARNGDNTATALSTGGSNTTSVVGFVISDSGGTRNWNDTASWVDGVVPSATSDIYATGTSGNLTINVVAAARSIDLTNYVGTLTHAAGVTLSVGNASGGSLKFVAGMTYTLGNAATSAISFVSTTTGNTITTGGKTFGNVTFNGVGGAWAFADDAIVNAFTLSNGTVTAPSGNLTITGNFTKTSGTFNHNSGTVTFLLNVGSIDYTPGGTILNNVIIDKTVAGSSVRYFRFKTAATIDGNLTVQNNCSSGAWADIFLEGTSTPTITVKGNLNFPSTAATEAVRFGQTNSFIVNLEGSLTMADSNTILYADLNFTGTGTQTITKTAGTIDAASDWTAHKPSGVITPGSDVTGINWNVDTADYGAVFQTNGAFKFTFTTFDYSNGTFTAPDNAMVATYGNFTQTAGTFSSFPSDAVLNAFTLSTGTFTAPSGNLTITGNFTKTSGTFNNSSGTVTFLLNVGSIDYTPGGTILNNVVIDKTVAGSSVRYFRFKTAATIDGNLTVKNNCSSGAWADIFLEGTSTPTITVKGNLNFPSTAATEAVRFGQTNSFIVNLEGSLTMADSNTILYADLNFTGTGTQTITKTAGTIDAASDWTVNKASDSVVLASAITGPASATITAGTLYTAGNTFTPTTLTVSSGANLKINGPESITAAPTLSAGSTVEYVGDNVATDVAIKSFDYSLTTLKINDVNATKRNFTLPNGTRVFNNINIISGKLDATSSNYNLSVSGNWSNAGIFTPRGGTVSLTGADSSTQQISGSTTFNNLSTSTSSNSVGRTLQFAAGSTTTVSGTWTVTGYSGKVITLAPSSAATWYINPTAWAVDYVDVSYSTNQAGAKINPTNSIDGGNTTNWFTPAVTIPDPASGVVISNPTTDGFDVDWTDNSSNETGFYLYISSTNTGTCSLATYSAAADYTIGTGVTTKAVTGQSLNTQYCAKVVAYNSDGNAADAFSNNKYTLANKPGAPTVNGASKTAASAVIDTNSNPSRTEYAISNATIGSWLKADGTLGSSEVWQTYSNWGGVSGVINTGLASCTAYGYQVKARNGDNMETSLSATGTVSTPTSIAKPTALTGSVRSQQAILDWTNPSSIYFDHSEIYRSTEAGTVGQLVSGSLTATSYTDSSLTNGTSYYYTVRAIDSCGNSADSAQLKLTPTDLTDLIPPTCPTNLRASSIKSTELTLIWDAATDNIGVTGYKIYNATTNIQIAAVTNNSYKITGLTPDTSYQLYVIGYDAAGNQSSGCGNLTVKTSAGDTFASNAFLIINGAPGEIKTGVTFPNNIKVMAVDAGGQPIVNYSGNVYFSSSDSKAKLSWNSSHQYNFSASDAGTHSFDKSGFELNTVGNQTLTVTDTRANGTVDIKVLANGGMDIVTKAEDTVNNLFANLNAKGFTPEAANISTAIITAISALITTPILLSTVFGMANLWPQILYLLAHLLQLIGIRKKRNPWGTVFNSQTGQPITFAVVKIFDKEYNRLLETAITDSAGRFGFLVKTGVYYVSVQKAGYVFPSTLKVSGYFDSVYTGGNIAIGEQDKTITVNISLDPRVKATASFKLLVLAIRISKVLNKMRLTLLVLGTLFALLLIIMAFNVFYVLSLAFYVLIAILEYMMTKRARPYGVITDIFGKPLDTTIVRIYGKRSNRLIETEVTDAEGRFKFLVNPGVYYLTAVRPDYVDFKSHIMYLEKEKTMVSVNIKLKKYE